MSLFFVFFLYIYSQYVHFFKHCLQDTTDTGRTGVWTGRKENRTENTQRIRHHVSSDKTCTRYDTYKKYNFIYIYIIYKHQQYVIHSTFFLDSINCSWKREKNSFFLIYEHYTKIHSIRKKKHELCTRTVSYRMRIANNNPLNNLIINKCRTILKQTILDH